jgi:protein-tyrosine phosphatase
MSDRHVRIFEVGDYDRQIDRAVELLRGEKLVLLPTETVYGLTAMLKSPAAMERLRELRGGERKRPFVIHVPSREEALALVGDPGPVGLRLIRKAWPGPVALVFDLSGMQRDAVARRLEVPAELVFDGTTITVRCPDHIVAGDVIGKVKGTVVMSPCPLPRDGEPVPEGVDLVLDAGPTRFDQPSTIVRVRRDGYDIVREGIVDRRTLDRIMRRTVLFVCSGNTCRSPMAEALARKAISDRLRVPPSELEQAGVSVLSAGSYAIPGARASEHAVTAVASLGADLSRHRSRPLSPELINQADLILAMGRSHQHAVTAISPAASDKTFLLDPSGDVEDPIGGDASLYLELATHLTELIRDRLNEHFF